jgi:hypothetical protein
LTFPYPQTKVIASCTVHTWESQNTQSSRSLKRKCSFVSLYICNAICFGHIYRTVICHISYRIMFHVSLIPVPLCLLPSSRYIVMHRRHIIPNPRLFMSSNDRPRCCGCPVAVRAASCQRRVWILTRGSLVKESGQGLHLLTSLK